MLSNILAGVLSGILLVSPVGDTAFQTSKNYVRLGSTSLYNVDLDRNSIKVLWGDGVDSRIIESTIRLIPSYQQTIKVAGKNELVLQTELLIKMECDSSSIDVVKSYISTHQGVVDISMKGGPLSEYKRFGKKSSMEILEAFCSQTVPKRKLSKPLMV